MTPEKLETSLREIFRLASIWNCILLFEDVDTFFSQRSKADTATTKNALVSVFLRVLDYYDGILFLTTHRAGVLDEAFKCRIHYKIYYPELSLEQSLDIWKLNIQRVHQIEKEMSKTENRPPFSIDEVDLLDFAKYHFKQGSARWDGRQIRNAFQVALSLAYQESREEIIGSVKPPVLSVKHFEIMHAMARSAADPEFAFNSETCNGRSTDKLIIPRWKKEPKELPAGEAQVASSLDNDGGLEGGGVSNGAPAQWANWKMLALGVVPFLRAALRLSPFHPYLGGGQKHDSLFRDSLCWIAAAAIFVVLVLMAMQLDRFV